MWAFNSAWFHRVWFRIGGNTRKCDGQKMNFSPSLVLLVYSLLFSRVLVYDMIWHDLLTLVMKTWPGCWGAALPSFMRHKSRKSQSDGVSLLSSQPRCLVASRPPALPWQMIDWLLPIHGNRDKIKTYTRAQMPLHKIRSDVTIVISPYCILLYCTLLEMTWDSWDRIGVWNMTQACVGWSMTTL